jgi:hypothetical protein
MRAMRLLLRLGIAALAVLCADTFFHRDPFVRLGNGYAIGAAYGSDPCRLIYIPGADRRSHSEWTAIVDGTKYMLVSNKDSIEFDSEDEWRRAWRERHAKPSGDAIRHVQGITGFKCKDRYVIGCYTGGYFRLDTANDDLRVWTDEAAWQAAVEREASMDMDDLVSPRSRLVQSRDALGWGGLAVTTAIVLPWSLAPLWRKPRINGFRETHSA